MDYTIASLTSLFKNSILGVLILGSLFSCQPTLPEEVQVAYDLLPNELDYNLHVKPILSDKCFACHGPDQAKQKAGLRLDMAEMAYGDLPKNPGKKAITSGNLAKSEFFHRIISDDPDYVMPTPESHLTLSSHEKAILVKWMQDGAEYKPHWAFIEPVKASVPTVQNTQWPRNEVDYFILAKLEQEKLTPSQIAAKELLLRRLYLNLTGLPPTPEQLDSFVYDQSPNAYEKQVDLLLASPHFGEKMAIDWLDLARFSDSHGYTVDKLRDMSPYRDWVINAFNKNMPYDRFIHEQLAGDLMPNPTKDMIIATAFNRNHQQNSEGGIVEEEFQTEYVVDRTNTFGDALLGITLSCAKCHDHKYDPISQKNYFELFSFFNNVQEAGQISLDNAMPAPTLLLPTTEQEAIITELEKHIHTLKKEYDDYTKASSPDFDNWIQKKQYRSLSTPSLPQTGLQAFYNFDKKSFANQLNPRAIGILKRDAGTLGNTPEFVNQSDNDVALKLDGDVFLDLPGVGVFRRSEPFSIGIKVWVPEDLQEGVIFHKTIAERLFNFRGYHLYLKDSKLEVSVAHAAPANAISRVTKQKVPKNKWIHLTMTYDGSARANGLRIFLDGKEMESTITADELTKDILFYDKNQSGLQIGGWWRGSGFRNGLVDNITVYNRTLLPFEVAILAGINTWDSITSKAPESLTQMERQILQTYYTKVVAPKGQTMLRELTNARTKLAEAVVPVQELMVMKEMPTRKKAHVLLRGEYANKGEEVFPATPAAILPFPEQLPKNRYGLAQWLTHPKNPLTARVAVNRYWQNMFGMGLVKTAEDFGNQGELPSHPALLDWLAVSFMESGWDVKKLHKLMAMSMTFQQSAHTTPELREKDPENRLLARGPTKRLSAEMIRDNALMASGLINTAIGGKSIKPYQPAGLWEINSDYYVADTGQAVYRRSLYIVTKRSVPNPTLATFDAVSRSYCVVRRQETNTPLQALVTLNDPTFNECSRVLGEQMAIAQNSTNAITQTYQKLTGKKPSEKELALLNELYQHEYQKFSQQPHKMQGWLKEGQYRIRPSTEPASAAAYTIVTSTILNSDATLTLR